LYERDNQGNALDGSLLDTILKEDRWYNFELKVLKDSARVLKDGIEILSLFKTGDYTDTEPLEVGMYVHSWGGAPKPMIAQYDWLFLRKLCTPEPSYLDSAAEDFEDDETRSAEENKTTQPSTEYQTHIIHSGEEYTLKFIKKNMKILMFDIKVEVNFDVSITFPESVSDRRYGYNIC